MSVHADAQTDKIIEAIKSGTLTWARPSPGKRVQGGVSPALRNAVAAALGTEVMSEIELDRQAHAAESEATMASKHEEAVRMSAQRQTALNAAAAARREDLAGLPMGGFIFLDTPFFIWGDPDYRIEANASSFNSSARFKFHRSATGSDSVTFWFQWVNDADTFATLDAAGEVLVNGNLAVWASGGHLDVSETTAFLIVELQPLRWWQQPATVQEPEQPSQDHLIAQLEADAHWYQRHASASMAVFGSHGGSFQSFVVPPHATAVFAVQLRFDHLISDGTADVDFQSGAFSVRCPGVALQRTG